MLLPVQAQSFHGAMRDAFFAKPQTRAMGAGRDLTARRKDGAEFPVEVGLNPIQTEDGVVALASIVDITTRRQNEDLRSKQEAAEAAYKAKGDLLAIASHDLKNPLGAIAGLAEIMLEMKRAEPAASGQDIEFLQNICDASKQMSEVIQGILENEGIEQQVLTFDAQGVDLSALCSELIRFNESLARRKDIRLVSNIHSGIKVPGNETRLREALENYVSNAIKYSPPGKTVEVRLTALPEQNLVEFGVKDEGPGLTEDDKTKVFGKFKKLSARPTGGESSTGLGLSIVKTIVELHKGTVGCESRAGEGAYFWARLPLNSALHES
jgi:signal transduction histidine kinase